MRFRTFHRLFCFALIGGGCCAQWPQPKTAMDAYHFVQSRRDEAEKLWRRGDPQGVAILYDTLAYLQQPLVTDLAAGNVYLAARQTNINLDLAEAYAIEGQNDRAISCLQKVAQLTPDPGIAQFLEQQKSFARMRGTAEFQAVLAGFRRFQRFWDSSALDTPYRENLSEAEKLAGLGKFWSEVKYNFAFPDKLMALDWDRLYLTFTNKVIATKSTAEYYAELMRFCAQLQDGHTNVYPPDQVDLFEKPPLRTELVENRVLILEVASPLLEQAGIRCGMEIAAVDGIPAVEYGRQNVAPYQSASTPQDLDLRTFSYGFLRGPGNQPVRLSLRTSDGRTFERVVPRKGYGAAPARPSFRWRMLPHNIAYVALNSFEDEQALQEWAKAFPALRRADAMVLDLRLNGGGDGSVGYQILSYLAEKPFAASRTILRSYNPTERAHGNLMDFKVLPADEIQPQGKDHYSKPVAVLAGPATFSAAEDFLAAWRNSRRGKIIGEPSGGSTGQPLFFKLPGGGTARVCTKHDTFPDGAEWVGKGIIPDVLVRPTVADLRAGRDSALEAALKSLSQEMNSPSPP